MVYSYKIPGKYKIPAQVAGEELSRIEQEHGELTPSIVLESARDEDSRLHDAFEWRDDVAAERYRLDQASKMIRAITVKREDAPTKDPVPAFVNITVGKQKAKYVNISAAMNDPVSKMVTLQNALMELRAFRRKYKQLSELAQLFQDIEELEEAI